MTSEQIVAVVACPSCGAPAGVGCRGRSLHVKRRGRAELLHEWRNPPRSPDLAIDRERWRQQVAGRRR